MLMAPSTVKKLSPFILLALIMTLLVIHERVFLSSLLLMGHPVFNFGELIRTLLIAAIAFLSMRFIAPPASETTISPNRSSSLVRMAGWGLLGGNFAISLLFVVNPTLFTRLQYEDFVVEYLSFALLLAAVGICVYHVLLLRQSSMPIYVSLIFVLFGGVFFVIAMEEVSWFQRILSFETPEAFAGNRQDEFNFHNFFSNTSEEVYYMLGFLLLVLFPFASSWLRNLTATKRLQFFIPSETALLVGTIPIAYNYHLWNRVPTQYAFFCTLFILVFLVYRARSSDLSTNQKLFRVWTLVAFVGTQAAFFLLADNMRVDWSVSEYKEMFIPAALMLYSLDMLYRTLKSRYQGTNQSINQPA